jgi:hypothetical protein
VTVTAVRNRGAPAYELRIDKIRMGLVVAARTLRPVEVLIGPGRSILEPAKAARTLRVVERAFGLRAKRGDARG